LQNKNKYYVPTKNRAGISAAFAWLARLMRNLAWQSELARLIYRHAYEHQQTLDQQYRSLTNRIQVLKFSLLTRTDEQNLYFAKFFYIKCTY
jgi:hypothetical protein